MTEITKTPEYLAAMQLLESGEINMADAARLCKISRQRLFNSLKRNAKLVNIHKARNARVRYLWRKALDEIEQ